MIKSWANSATRRFAETGKSKFSGMEPDAADEAIAMLDAATTLADISPLKSFGLHALKGNRKGQWAISINAQWRLCFRFDGGDAYDVEIVDYH